MVAIFPIATSRLTGRLSSQFEAHAAEFDAGLGNRITPLRRAFFDAGLVGDLDDERAQALPRLEASGETDRDHIHRNPTAIARGRERLLDDGRPVPADAGRVSALDDDLREPPGDVGLDRG